MVILVDSREKKNSYILDYFRKQKIAYQVEKLEYGDYSFMIPASAAGEDIFFHRDCVVERKASLKKWQHRFNANIQFISPEYAGYYIYSTFTYFCREVLK